MELEVYWLQLAEDKLEDIYSYYYSKAGKRIASKLINGIVDTTLELEKHPRIGQVEELLNDRKEEFRYLVYKNLYWVNIEKNRIEIANVFDTRQNPKTIQETKK